SRASGIAKRTVARLNSPLTGEAFGTRFAFRLRMADNAGISGSGVEVYGLRNRIRIHRGRTTVLLSKGLQERAEALPQLQSETAEWRREGRWPWKGRNFRRMFAMWPRNNGAFQT